MAMKLTLRALAAYEKATGHHLLREGTSLDLDKMLHLAYYAIKLGGIGRGGVAGDGFELVAGTPGMA